MASQQDYSRLYQALTQPQQSRQAQPAPLPAQPVMHRQQKEIERQTANTQQYIKPSHYLPPQQGSKTTSHVSVQNQVPIHVDSLQGQGLQNLSSASNEKNQKQPVAAVQALAPFNTLTRDESFASANNSTMSFL